MPPAQQHWKVMWILLSGNNHCPTNDMGWIREGDGKFRFFDVHNRKELWAATQAPDGSVNTELRHGRTNVPYRVTVPAGDKPRAFQFLDLSKGCRIKMEPM
jgi:hypothetical protein